MVDHSLQYPDISAILSEKAMGRRQRGALSFTEKLLLLEQLRDRLKPIAVARENRQGRR